MPALDAAFITLRDGARLRHVRWEQDDSRRGVVLLLTGRSESVEKYVETAGDLNARGFAVRALDWRGQGLSDRLLPQRQPGHVEDFGVLVEDLAEVVERVVQPGLDGRPLIVLGHSMGGLVGLRFLAEHPGHVRLAAFTAPMVDVLALRQGGRMLARLAAVAVRRGHGGRYAFGQHDYDPDTHVFRNNWLTGDPERFETQKRAFQANPDLRVGGVTWGWLLAADRSTRILLQPDYARRIDVPVLIASAGRERLVSNAAHRHLARMLPDCTLKTYPASLHEILMERDVIRDAFWADFDRFLADHGL